MNTINAYNNIANLNVKNELVTSTNDVRLTTANEIDKTENNNKDTIQIDQKNKIAINTKKAYDALQDTCKEFGTVRCNGEISGTMQYYVNNLIILMRDEGMSVPNFDVSSNNTNNNDFQGFIKKLKDFAHKKMEDKNNENIAPDNFFDFCDVWEKKLTQNGCS